MVINEAVSPPSIDQSNMDAKNTVAVKQHVHEELDQHSIENNIKDPSDSEKVNTKKKSAKKSKKQSIRSNLEAKDDVKVTQIDENDLDELRTVYKKCKAVMKKIESKYGHLLDLDDLGDRKRKRHTSESEHSDLNVCKCPANKKIVFDDEGKEITLETHLGSHICVHNLKRTRSTDHVNINHVQVEYDAVDTTLPDDLQSLANILHDPEIDVTYRNKVIQKIKMLKQEYTDEVRFNKHFLIEKLKSDPDEILDFKGTNLKSLPGYVVS